MTDLKDLYADAGDAGDGDGAAVAIDIVGKDQFDSWLDSQPEPDARWIKSAGFKAGPGDICLIPGADGDLARVIAGASDEGGMWDTGGLRDGLPGGHYRLPSAADTDGTADGEGAALAWGLGAYKFDRYKESAGDTDGVDARLVWPDGCDAAKVLNWAESIYLVRDLINTPAGDMGPDALADAARAVAEAHGAEINVITGGDLLKQNYPAVHAVGRASDKPPCLIDITWGDAKHAKVTLVGKGVCFDTGGLDIKAADGMKLMKKDMGGGAHVLGLGNMIMASRLPVRLRVLVPAVENSISGNALYPMDVVTTRSGKTVEIGNTDAEGRVILADALYEGAREEPHMLIDFATLTGAARVALGPDLPALFCNDDRLAAELLAAGDAAQDPLWRLPLWAGYRKLVDGKTADLTNAPEGRFGGAITAALFLGEFAGAAAAWAHIDLMGWNTAAKPGRPEGGEAMAIRAVFRAIEERFKSPPK
ncbi:MAG: leucyl aminopeptidase family protein [Rhodospirillales bacterium]|nr:leucyl aminopeptidase family protein [Rhodospirillales bacterium]